MNKAELKRAANGFKIRCSAIGQIMTNGRGKDAGMGQTAKTYCENWLKEIIYERRNGITSKYLEKGLVVEDDSIQFAAEQLGWGMVFKNLKFYQNEYLTGTPDVILPDTIADLKNSWNAFSFPLFENRINKDYFLQMQGYMELVDRPKAQLVYTLMSTPPEIIERELRYKTDENTTQERYELLVKDYEYDDVAPEFRIKKYDFDRDPEIIQSIYNRVQECRKYLLTLIENI